MLRPATPLAECPRAPRYRRWWLRQQAIGWQWLRRDRRALAAWLRLHQVAPDDSAVAASIGHLLACLSRPAEAHPWLEAATRLAPRSAVSWFNRGFVEQQLGDHRAAVESFERAIADDQGLDRAHYGLGMSLVALGRDEAALASFARNAELQPLSPFGWYQLGHVQHRLGRAAELQRTIRRLAGFEPQVARQLSRETGRPTEGS